MEKETTQVIRQLLRNYPLRTEALRSYNKCQCGRLGPSGASFENGWDSAIQAVLKLLERP